MSTNPIPDNNPCEDQTGTTGDAGSGDTGTEIQTETDSTTTPDISASGEIRTLLDANASVDDTINANNQYKHAYFEGNSGSFGTNEPDIDDYFRRITGRYWAFGNSNNKIEYVHKAVDESSIPIRYDFSQSVIHHSTGELVELFSLTMPQDYQYLSYYSPDLGTAQNIFKKLIIDMRTRLDDQEFTDHSFRVASPVQRRDIDATAPFPNLLYANVNPTYNFYIPSYEEIAAGIPESVLPNLYTFISQMLHDQNDEDATINPLFQKHVTLDGYIAIGDLKKMTTLGGYETEISGQYFDIYSKKYPHWDQSSRSNSEIESKFKNQLVSHSNVNLLKDFNDKKELFPMFVDIKFSTDTNTDFAELLKDTEMGCVLMKEFVKGSDISSKQFREFLQTYENPNNPLVTHGSATMQPDGLNSRGVLDIGDWFENISNMTSGQEDISAVFLGDQRDIMSDPRYSFFKSLMTILLNGRLSKLEKKHRRTYKDILNGKLANSETVAYRIEKKSGDTLIQNFYLPNSNEINIHNFIDTQVKYNKEYTYNIYALEAVYGTSYKINIRGTAEDPLPSEQLKVTSKSSVKIVEVPYYEYTNKLLDSPPVQPNVEIIPFRGIDNRIKINLSSNTGKYDLHPVALEESEERENKILKLSQDRLPDEPLQYESDDHSTDFEVYRVDKHPSEYSDFKGNRIADLNADLATAVSMIDNILPNKKYWYIFRSKDNHDHVSYPSPVYQVEMVNSDGSIYPLISVVDFKVIDPRSTTKNLKRLMQIAPAFPQTILQTEELDMMTSVKDAPPSSFKLSVEGESIWENSTFKIRLTSKKTGKKADINITFNHEHENLD
jgi:hypothetical protein